ncbi:hypothetical protein D3C86_1335290 [compost metagenome]
MEAIWMITPLFCASICGKNALSSRTGASKLVWIVCSQSSSFSTAKPPPFVSEPPSALIRISSFPNIAKTSFATLSVPSALLKSAATKYSFSFRVSGTFLAVTTTIAPAFKSRSAMALPVPFVPPVTRATLPCNS